MSKHIYAFGGGSAEGEGSQKDLLGGKGAGLAAMSRLGIPVPPGFTLTTEVCTYYQEHGDDGVGRYPDGLEAELEEHLRRVEEMLGQRFGDPQDPLLFSVRSGAPWAARVRRRLRGGLPPDRNRAPGRSPGGIG